MLALIEGLAPVGGHGQGGKEDARAVAELLSEGGQAVGAWLAAQ
jgi:hypothetical protein